MVVVIVLVIENCCCCCCCWRVLDEEGVIANAVDGDDGDAVDLGLYKCSLRIKLVIKVGSSSRLAEGDLCGSVSSVSIVNVVERLLVRVVVTTS